MKKRTIRFCCGVMAAGLLICGIPSGGAEGVTQNHLLWNVAAAAETAVTVSNENEFLSALAQKQKNIVVTGSFSVRGKAEASGQMMPVEIPDGTVITGNNTGSITFSGPIQIMGDGVVIRDIQIGFISTNSMNSVPHREIFLAGHSLTLDNVKTYLPGGGDASLGGFGGTEKELLPTIYAGGYHSNTAVGTKASLTVVNANSDTMFQNIYMGHKASAGERTAYTGSVELNLDADAKVRDIISAEDTTSATLTLSGKQNGYDEISLVEIRGNANTVLTVNNCAVSGVITTGIKDIVLDAGGRLQPKDETAQLNNITLKNGGCLDLTKIIDAQVKGNFTSGGSAAKGKLVLDQNGYVQINGQVSGVTQFQVGSHAISGNLLNEHTYIIAENGTAGNFVLSDKDINNNYSLICKNGMWTAYRNYVPEERELDSIEIKSCPKNVYTGNIPTDITDKTDDAPYLDVIWKDQYGEDYTFDEVANEYDGYGFYNDMILIRSDYWNSDDEDIQQKKDWENPIRLDVDKNESDRYYLIAYGEVKTGKYTLLLCSDPFDDPNTVADVKALKDTVLAEKEIIFTDEPDVSHQHVAGEPVKENEIAATCTQKGSYDKVVYCKDKGCGEELSRENIMVSALGHKKGDTVIENRVEAKVGVEGSYEKVMYCTTCHEELSREKIVIPALKEPDTEEPGTETPAPEPDTEKPGTETPEPDTEKPGTETPEPDTEKPAHKHSYVLQKTVEATCEKEGEKVYSCTCGESYKEKIAKKSHTPEKKLTPAKPGSNGKNVTVCSVCKTVLQQETINAPKKLKLSKERYVYDGKAKKPAIKVTDNKGKVISSGSYKVSYQNNKNTGKATVTVKFRGNYTGALKKTFEICPKGTSLTDVKAAKKSFTLKWKKQTSQTSGYEIAYATDASFSKKNTKTTVVKGNKTTSKGIKGLKPGKKYYIKIRTYKEIKSGTKKVKIYSDWSNKKSVKTKK